MQARVQTFELPELRRDELAVWHAKRHVFGGVLRAKEAGRLGGKSWATRFAALDLEKVFGTRSSSYDCYCH